MYSVIQHVTNVFYPINANGIKFNANVLSQHVMFYPIINAKQSNTLTMCFILLMLINPTHC